MNVLEQILVKERNLASTAGANSALQLHERPSKRRLISLREREYKYEIQSNWNVLGCLASSLYVVTVTRGLFLLYLDFIDIDMQPTYP